MLRILVLTYYFPPINAVAAYRPLSWAANLKESGIAPVVLTRHWQPGSDTSALRRDPDNRPVEQTVSATYTLFRLPFRYGFIRKIGERWLSKVTLLRKAYYLGLTCCGYFNIDMDPSPDFTSFLKEHLKEFRYDGVLVTTPPFSLIRLARMIHRKYRIPYAVDFRDLWGDNAELKHGYVAGDADSMVNRLSKIHIGRWLSNAALITVTTPAMTDRIKCLGYTGPIEVLLNGYESELLEKYRHFTPSAEVFTISCIGTIYPEQDTEIFINGFELFLERNPDAKVQLRLIGVGFNLSVQSKFAQQIPAQYLMTTDRVTRDHAIRETFEAHVLVCPVAGFVPAKMYEYLASGRNILVVPDRYPFINSLVVDAKAGKAARDEAAVCEALESWYCEWQASGTVLYRGDSVVVSQYSRKNQAAVLAGYLKEAFAK